MSFTNPTLSLGSGNVVMSATGPNELTLSGPGPSDVNLTGVDTFTFLGQLNTGTSAVGGYLFRGRGDRQGVLNTGNNYSFGNISSANPNAGIYLPYAGQAVYFAYAGGTAATCSLALRGSVSGDIMTLNLTAETSKVSTTPASYVGNEFFTVIVTSGTTGSDTRVAFTFRFN